MRATVFVLAALLCVGCVVAQNVSPDVIKKTIEDVVNSDRGTTFVSPLPDQACKDYGREFLRACTVDAALTSDLKNDFAKAASLLTNAPKPLQFDGNAFAGYVGSMKPGGACCNAACQVAKKGCLCVWSAWTGMDAGFSLNGGGGFRRVLDGIAQRCKSERGSNFAPTIAQSENTLGPLCSEEHRVNVVNNYSCSI